jgi:hypothetical protein
MFFDFGHKILFQVIFFYSFNRVASNHYRKQLSQLFGGQFVEWFI